jgi:NAD(P)-dependent dehydrogenase (short-subunit alcohol dehydrogenase family)
MDLELDGRTAAVIGGSSGIGATVVGVLAEEGCDVAVTYRRSRAGAQQAAADVRAHGRRAWVVHLELGRPESATTAPKRCRPSSAALTPLCSAPVTTC